MTKALRLAILGVCALCLSGCISLLPKSKPAQLYRFGQGGEPEASSTPAAGTVGVFRANGSFQQESAGDRLLTITGEKVAYIAQARWVAPASTLFNQAVLGAFEAAPGKVRLVSRGEMAQSTYVLRLDVRNFETHYDRGPKAAPEVVVRVHAVLTRQRDRGLVGEKVFEARVRAGDNRVSAISRGYDQALQEVLGGLVGWTEKLAASGG